MKRNLLLTLAAIGIAFLLASCAVSEAKGSEPSASKGKAVETTFTGYLIDQKCGLKETSREDGIDLKKNPEKHTLSCNLASDSAASGYGISMKDDSGAYKFFPLDDAGNKMAKESVLDKTSRKDGILVELKYMQNGDVIELVSITEITETAVTDAAVTD
jgi:hypothetical protein